MITFDPSLWAQRYPEFASLPSTLATLYSQEAVLYCGIVNEAWFDQTEGLVLLNMVTAHIAVLNQPGSSPLVGRVASATEGSVSVQTVYSDAPFGSKAWFDQTKYGAAAWTAMTKYRSGPIYATGCPRDLDPWFPGLPMGDADDIPGGW